VNVLIVNRKSRVDVCGGASPSALRFPSDVVARRAGASKLQTQRSPLALMMARAARWRSSDYVDASRYRSSLQAEAGFMCIDMGKLPLNPLQAL
jgi:hypothetical protein